MRPTLRAGTVAGHFQGRYMSAMGRPAFAGIDVAIARGKYLPVVVCTWRDGRLVPEPLRRLHAYPPRGPGNAAVLNDDVVTRFVDDTAGYLVAVCDLLDLDLQRIGLDAPSAPCSDSRNRRAAEVALDRAGIPCFATKSVAGFDGIRERVRQHLASGGPENHIPFANMLWMLVGFRLFDRLREIARCIEVYPHATVCSLGAEAGHKTRAGAAQRQLRAASRYTGWPSPAEPVGAALEPIAFGPAHDRVDAYLSAWVGSLPEAELRAFGVPPDDVIWTPALSDVVRLEPIPAPVAAQEPILAPDKDRPTRLQSLAREGRDGARLCPACHTFVFQHWPWGWDAHAAHTCTGLVEVDPDARKCEFRTRFRHLHGDR